MCSASVRLGDPKVKAAIATINEHAWTPIEHTDAIFDEQAGMWVSRAEVAEVPFPPRSPPGRPPNTAWAAGGAPHP